MLTVSSLCQTNIYLRYLNINIILSDVSAVVCSYSEYYYCKYFICRYV